MTQLLKNGDFVRYSGGNRYLTNGKEYQVFDVKQGFDKPTFHLIDDTGDTLFALFPNCAHGKWEIVGKEEEAPETCAQVLGYNVGDTFKVIKGFQYEVGSIVTLYFDDGTGAPLFAGEGTRYNNADGKPGAFVGLDSVEKIVPGAAKEVHKGYLLCVEPCLGFTKEKKYLIKAAEGDKDLACGGFVAKNGYNVIDDDGAVRYVAVVEGLENNFKKVVDGEISEGVVLPHREETTTTTTTTTKESTVSEFKINDKVRVKSEISEPAYCWGQVRPGDIGVIKEIYSTRLLIDFPRQRGWKARPSEMELVKEEEELKPTQEKQNMTTTTSTSTARQPELKSFCVDLSEVSADQANELLSLAVALGAHRVEGVSDGEMDEDEAVAKYPNLGGASFFNRNSYGYAGVDNDNDTYLLDDTGPYEDNLMTYEEAKLMLTGTPKVEEKVSAVHKPEMKAFYLPFSAVDGDATRVMEIFKRLQAVGVELHDLAHNRGEDDKVRHDQANEGFTGACCYIGAFKIFGVTQKGDKFLTYVNDYASEFSTGAVEITLAELEEFLSKIEKPVKASNKPKLRQRKLKVTYTNGKPYLLKNVVSVDIKPEEGTVNVTYNQKKGKVVMHNNVVIPFSELKSVKFEGPGSVGAEYIFKNGKVVQVIQDFSHADFQHKSH